MLGGVALSRCCAAVLADLPAVAAVASRWRHISSVACDSPRQAGRFPAGCADEGGRQQHLQQQQQQRRHYSDSSSSSSNAMISNTTSFLRNLHNGAEIFLVGTAHVSKLSAKEVSDMIRLVKPQSVMVELCAQRAAKLRQGGTDDSDFLKQMLSSLFGSGGGTLSQKLVKVSLPAMYRLLRTLGMDPGAEFKVALEEADRCGARAVYGDRDGQATLRRLSETVNLQQLLQMATGAGLPDPPPELLDMMEGDSGGFSGLEAQVEGMKSRQAVRAMIEYMRKVNPALATALIDERDEYMVQSLLRLEGRVVGVVGLAHLDGIERRWEALQFSRAALTMR